MPTKKAQAHILLEAKFFPIVFSLLRMASVNCFAVFLQKL